MYYLDYANGWPSASQVKAGGYGGTIRYVTAPGLMNPPGRNQKHITRAEYDQHRAAGLDILLVFQGGTTDADGGYSLGQRNAQLALDGCNSPKGPYGYTGPIFFTNDRTTLPNPNAWRAYLDGAASVLGKNRVGAYGFANAMDAAVSHASFFWQAGRRSDVRAHTHVWQDNNVQVNVGGITCDRNLILKEIGKVNADMQAGEIVNNAQTGQPTGDTFNNFTWWTNKVGWENKEALTRVEQKLDAGVQATIDYDVLASKVAPLVAAQVGATLSAAVADELKRRLES